MSGHTSWEETKRKRLGRLPELVATYQGFNNPDSYGHEGQEEAAAAIIVEVIRLVAEHEAAYTAARAAALAATAEFIADVEAEHGPIPESARAKAREALEDLGFDPEPPYNPFDRSDPRTTAITAEDEALLKESSLRPSLTGRDRLALLPDGEELVRAYDEAVADREATEARKAAAVAKWEAAQQDEASGDCD